LFGGKFKFISPKPEVGGAQPAWEFYHSGAEPAWEFYHSLARRRLRGTFYKHTSPHGSYLAHCDRTPMPVLRHRFVQYKFEFIAK